MILEPSGVVADTKTCGNAWGVSTLHILKDPSQSF